jgi:subtilisin family serine protease
MSLSQPGSRGSRSNRLLAARRRRLHSGPAKRTMLLEQLEQRTVLSADGLGSSVDAHLTVERPEYDPSSILVRFRPGAASANNPASIMPGTSNGRVFSLVPGLRVVKLGQGVGVEAALHKFRANPNVLYAEPNGRVQTMQTPSDPSFSSLYGLHNTGQTGGTPDADIDAPEAWNITTGNSNTLVAVIDTGIDYTHPDLAANIWTNPGEIPDNFTDDDGNGYVDDVHGYDFAYGDSDPFDDNYHGTHVAGTIGAVGNNDAGVVGVNWTAKIAAVKFLDADGYGSWEGAVAAIEYAVAIGARVSNNSWSGQGGSTALYDAIAAAGAAGHLFVAAASNEGWDADANPMYPAAYDLPNIISVAATDHNDERAYFSNWGATSVDLGAPGLDIYSTFPGNGYGYLSGTSMATPHVTGVAALAFSLAGNVSYTEIRDAILGSVDPIDALSISGPTPVATGGRLNALGTLEALGMAVAGSTPAAGAIVSTAPTDFVVHFSHSYDADTVQPGDLKVNNVAATSLTQTDSDTVTFHFGATPVTAQGVQTMHIDAGALAADPSSGLPNLLVHEWNATFRYDAVQMQVTSTNPPDGSAVQLALTSLDVNLNEVVDPNSVSESDLTLSQGSATGFSLQNGGTTIRFTLSGITSEGTLNASIAAGALTDGFGNPNQAFAGSYSLDIGTIPFPTPLVSVAPLGSLIYDPPYAGLLHAGDTDSFTINVDAGQTITVVVDPSAALRPTITLSGPLGGFASATAAGQDAVLQTVGPTTSGLYTVTVGSAGGSGAYTLEIILGAAVEMESHDGPPGTIQNIDASFIPLLKGATRGAVLGQTDASDPTQPVFSANFDSGIDGFVASGLWHRSNGHRFEGGHSPEYSMYFGAGEKYVQKGNRPVTFTEGTYEVIKKGKNGGAQSSTGTLTSPNINLPAGGQLTLDFNYLLQTQGSTTLDLARLQIKPTSSATWTTLASYNGVAESNSWRSADPVDVSAFAGQEVQIRYLFDTVNAQDNNFEGWYVDDVRITNNSPHDSYSFTAGADKNVTVVLDTQGGGDINVLLRNAAGVVLQAGAAGALNADKMIYNFDLPAAGVYNLAITGQSNTPYSLVVTLGAVFDRELNNSFATAQSMDGVVGSLGYLGVEGRVGYFTDFAEFSTSPEAAIIQAGLTPVQITNISSFDLSTIDVLMVNESNNGGLSAALSGRLAAIQTWVEGGGVFMVHDRFVSIESGVPESNPFLLGQSGIEVLRDFANGPDLDVIPPGSTLVISGPHGTITDSSLDGGNYSNHGFALGSSLPASAVRILSAGPDSNNVAAFSYPLGGGAVYYSTIPLDYYLDSPYGQPAENLAMVYTPNMLTYGDTLNPSPASDWYSVTAVAGATLELLTTTPGDGPGQPANGLDPRIELYSPAGVLVASGVDLADGRNEAINFPVLVGGLYRIRITAEGGTTGEYFLDPIQTVPPPPPPLLVASTARPQKTGKAGTAASASLLASAATPQKQAANQLLLDSASVDKLFAGAGQAGHKTTWYGPRPQADVADSLLDLVTSSVTRGKKGSARARH